MYHHQPCHSLQYPQVLILQLIFADCFPNVAFVSERRKNFLKKKEKQKRYVLRMNFDGRISIILHTETFHPIWFFFKFPFDFLISLFACLFVCLFVYFFTFMFIREIH